MEKISYFNQLIGELNNLEVEFQRYIRPIKDNEYVVLNLDNPVKFVRDALYKIKKVGDENNFDIFGDDSYIKYIYIAYLEETLKEMNICLQNMLSYSNSGFLDRITHLKLVKDSVKLFSHDYFLLQIFDPSFVLDYYRMLLASENSFDFFKKGMFYKYSVFILNELHDLGLEEDRDNYIFIMNYVRNKELELNNEDKVVEDTVLADVSAKYHVDFVALDKDYDVEVRGMDNEEDKGDSPKRKWI